jgi:uncharacterized protein
VSERRTVLPPGLPAPAPSGDGLEAPYWDAARRHELVCQRCNACGRFQWGPEWICHRCRSFDLRFEPVAPRGRIFAFERVWHPVHPKLAEAVPYVVLLVELPQADDVRMIGNLVGDPKADVRIGAEVEAVFEDHAEDDAPYTLVQWRKL